jgi:hypothetical protein
MEDQRISGRGLLQRGAAAGVGGTILATAGSGLAAGPVNESDVEPVTWSYTQTGAKTGSVAFSRFNQLSSNWAGHGQVPPLRKERAIS